MDSNPTNILLSQIQRVSLLLFSFALAVLIFFFRAGIDSRMPIDQLARKSLSPEIALSNGRPTIFEFYADWCMACREMAPSMLRIHNEAENELDFVLLNVDNELWKDLVDEYQINGIPQLILFDAKGMFVGRSVGVRTEAELRQVKSVLINHEILPSSFLDGSISALNSATLTDP